MDSEKSDWRQLYQEALFEPDLLKLPERIELASNAVQVRMREITEVSDRSRERDLLMDALRTLQSLRREKR